MINGDNYLRRISRGGLRRNCGRPRYHTTGQWADPGKNISYAIEGDEFVVRMSLAGTTGKSQSGKSNGVANSCGRLAIETLECATGHDLPKFLVLNVDLYTLINPIEDKK